MSHLTIVPSLCLRGSMSHLRVPSFHASRFLRTARASYSTFGQTYSLISSQSPPVILTSNNTGSPYFRQRRHYTPMTVEEEEREKKRVAELGPFQKDQELRKLNRDIARLEMFRGINSGELYTWAGRYKALARDYGMPLFAWYWMCWTSTAFLSYGAITVFNIDTIALIAQVDGMTGWDIGSRIDPEMGKIGMCLIVNECLEPLRLPVVIVTVKPVMDRFFPPKF